MAETIKTFPLTEPENGPEPQALVPSQSWQRLALAGVLLISLFMNFFQLGLNGFANPYYAAGVKSMLDSWHNFFFVSFDPGGFVTLDKPALGFWLQAASAKLLGFSPFSVYLPQALAGVLSVLVLYHLVRRHFGVVAALLAALALALSPISVVTSRNNTIDSTLVLVVLLGAWAVLRAAETGRLRWLLLAAVAVGLGFNVKMSEAYLVVPAYGLLYLLAAPLSLWKRIGHLALASVLLLVISLSWVLAVDITPAAQRPYVGSTQNNSELSLAIGYNGIDRLLGMFGRGAARNNAHPAERSTASNGNGQLTAGSPAVMSGAARDSRDNMAPPMGGGGFFGTGTPGPLRLFTEPMASQTAWLLPLAILGMLALAWQRRPRPQQDRQQQSLILWGMWLLTTGIFFSVAGFFHQYYLTMMAPPIAALAGIGLVMMWRDYRRAGWKGWLLPLALLATLAEQIYILLNYPTWGRWLIPALIVLGVVGIGGLLLLRPAGEERPTGYRRRFVRPTFCLGILALLLVPAVWTAIPVFQNTESQMPAAGPTNFGGFGNIMGPAGNNSSALRNERTSATRDFNLSGRRNDALGADTQLVRYLEARQGSTKFLLATPSSMTADSLILTTNKPVMALGGFSGGDPILTTSKLENLINDGTVRFFLLNVPQTQQSADSKSENSSARAQFSGVGGFMGGRQNALTNWVMQRCSAVPSSQWQSPASAGSSGAVPFGRNQLYDCAAH